MLSAQRHYSLARRGVSDGGAPSTQLSSWDRSMELFQVDVGLQRQHTYSQLTAVCGATRRLMPILFRPNRGSTRFPANFRFFIHITQHLQHSRRLVLLTLTLHNNFLFGSIGALCQKWCFLFDLFAFFLANFDISLPILSLFWYHDTITDWNR